MEKRKNCWVIPTDKPSNIVIATIDGKLKLNNNINDSVEYNGKNQHIYITNDEEIKEGDWHYNLALNSVEKTTEFDNGLLQEKIILTTDQELIKNGVQPIDDKFLEWFVKNPSCEIIEVEKAPYDGTKSIDKYWGGEYKITIPKEEPKQETLEEAAEIYAEPYRCPATNDNEYCKHDIISAFNNGAKWQQKRSYSEEDVKNAFLDGWQLRDGDLPFPKAKKKWFNKFKNK